MTPPPPRSPLFPDTTLFRSLCTPAGNDKNQDSAQFYAGLGNARFGSPFSIAAESDQSLSFVQDAGFWDPTSLDRKSTRLNSSHRCISYAVFCLKKKKKTQ